MMFFRRKLKRQGAVESENSMGDEKQGWSQPAEVRLASLHAFEIPTLAKGHLKARERQVSIVVKSPQPRIKSMPHDVPFIQRLLSPFIPKKRKVLPVRAPSLHASSATDDVETSTVPTTTAPATTLHPTSQKTTDAPQREKVHLTVETEQVIKPSKRTSSLRTKSPVAKSPLNTSPISPTIVLHFMKNGIAPPAPPVLHQRRILARPDYALAGMEVCAGAGTAAAKNRRKHSRRHSQSSPPIFRPKLSTRPSTANSTVPNSTVSTTLFPPQPGHWKTDPPSPRPLDDDIESSYTPPKLAPPPVSRQGRFPSPRSQPDLRKQALRAVNQSSGTQNGMSTENVIVVRRPLRGEST